MDNIKIIANNKKARYEYFIEDTYEAGIVLVGTEVKSLRQGKINFMDSYAIIREEEAFISGMHISPYDKGNTNNVDSDRERKLLLHKSEIRKLIGKIQQKGYSLIPTKIYFSRSKVKIEIALAKGKKMHDKREAIAKRDAKRQMDIRVKEFKR